MATTSQEILQAVDALQTLVDQTNSAMDSLDIRIANLSNNPNQPGAQAEYLNIVEDRKTIAEPWNNSSSGLVSTLTNLYNDATTDVKQSVSVQVTSIKSQVGNTVTRGRSQRDQQIPALALAIQQANSLSQTNPNSNLADDDSTTAQSASNSPGTGSPSAGGTGGTTPSQFNNLTGSADGDTETDRGVTTAGAAEGFGASPSAPVYSTEKQTAASAASGAISGKTTTNAGDTTSTTNTPPKPGVRLQNPLASYASYTYQLSLYMITPESYNAFILTGRKNIYANKEGVFLVAQSGGINNQSSKRAEGFNLDVYIDDLKMSAATGGQSTTTATNVTGLSFTIYEPYGFSFLSNLRKATLALAAKSKLPGMQKSTNPMKQFFVLGIKFQGYDIDGNIITSEDLVNATENNPLRSLSEKFFDIVITKMNFKLDGKVSTYRCTANSIAPSQSFGIKRGRIDTGVDITADNVINALVGANGLLTKLNEQQLALSKKIGPNGNPAIRYPNTYKIRFDGDTNGIEGAVLVNKADIDKYRLPMTKIANTTQSNEATSAKAVPDTTNKTITFKNDTPITMAISNIIAQSSYMTDALKVLYNASLEPSNDPNNPDEVRPPKNVVLQWYNLSSEIKPTHWDDILNDWALEVTYVIQPYLAPAVITPYADKLPKYYGPHKRYKYWYTGKNSEVISFEQSLDNAYMNIAMAPDASASQKAAGVSSKAGIRNNEDTTGGRNVEREAQNTYLTSLYSPKDWAESKLTIMGDPDFLVQDSPSSVKQVYSQFYGPDGVTINPNGGQVFIEIDFKEGVDYDNNTGLLTLNESITFWQDPDYIPKEVKSKIEGISFMVINVESSFSKGKFTQVLNLRINTFPQATKAAEKSASANRQANTPANTRTANTQANSGNGTSTDPTGATSNGDLRTDQPILASASVSSEQEYSEEYSSYLNTNQFTTTTPAPSANAAQTVEETPAGVAFSNGNPVFTAGNKPVADDDGTVNTMRVATTDTDPTRG